MFDLSPSKLLVLAAVALIVFGPDRLPRLAKDAATMLRTLRDLSTGARAQLGELGPEFAELASLRTLNPRTAVTRALLGTDADTMKELHPRTALRRALQDSDEPELDRTADTAGLVPTLGPLALTTTEPASASSKLHDAT